MNYSTITPTLENWFKRPLSKLPREVRPIAEAYIPRWPDLTPRQREERAREIDRQQGVKLRIKAERFRREQLMQANLHIGFYDAKYGSGHVWLWIEMGAVAPEEAALLFYGKNPLEFKDQIPFMGDEFDLMLRSFEDTASDGLARNLRDWLSVARARNLHGVAIDGWGACIAISARDASGQGAVLPPAEVVINERTQDTAPTAPVVAASDGPAKPKRTKRRTWRDVSETYLERTFKELQCPTVKEFFAALTKKAGKDSPFDKGVGQNSGVLFAREVSAAVTVKMIEGFVTELRKKM